MSERRGKSIRKRQILNSIRNSFKKRAVHFTLGLGLFLVSGILGAGVYFFPLEVRELKNRFRLSHQGIASVQIGELRGYLADRCGYPQDCSCVALIHGLGDHSMSWKEILLWPQETWKKQGLVTSLKLLALDLPGSGRSLSPPSPLEFRVRNQAKKVKEILGSTCSRWIVVGNSLGGWVAVWLALDWPSGVDRLILLSPAGLKEPWRQANSLFSEIPTEESIRTLHQKLYFKPRVLSPREINEIILHFKSRPVREIMQAQTEEDFLDLKFSSVQVPTLLAWGKEDRLSPMSVGYQFRDLKKNVIWREIPECGHVPQKECPAVVTQSIVDMITYGAM